MKKGSLSILFSFCFVICSAQVKFQKTYKIYGESDVLLTRPTNDGAGYFLSIATVDSTITQYDVCLARTNLFGDTIWTKIYGGNGNDGIGRIYEDGDGKLMMIGSTNSFGSGSQDIYLVKLNSVGDTLWTKVIGNSYKNIAVNSVKLINKSYVILSLQDIFGTLYDPYLIKTDSSGNILWNKCFSAPDNDDLTGLVVTNDNGFIISGSTKSYGAGGYDTYVIRTDSLGNIIWAKTYGGPQGDGGSAMVKCADGILIANSTNSFGQGGNDIYVIKLDFMGNLLWAKTYGTSIDEAAGIIKQTQDNGFIIGGFYGVVTGDRGEMLMKIDSLGNFQWAKSYGSAACNDDFSNATLTNDGGFMISGSSCSFGGWYAYLIKTDSLGNSGCYEQNLNLITQDITSLLTITNPTPTVYSDTTIKAKNTQTRVYNGGLITTTLCFTTDVEETERVENEAKIYPNPNNGIFSFTFKLKSNEKGVIQIYDIAGKLIKSYQLSTTDNVLNINNTDLNAGTYLYKYLINGSVSKVDKLIIIK